jgi:integrase/recombinase XerD
MHTRDWQIGLQRSRDLELNGIRSTIKPRTIEESCQDFLVAKKTEGLRDSSLRKYNQLLKQLQVFCRDKGLVFLSQLGDDEVSKFRVSWTNRNLSARKKFEHLRSFFRFCVMKRWTQDNPTAGIKPPIVNDPPVLPFSEDEVKKILTACDSHPQPTRALQLRALVLLMRNSGLRIGDACTLARERIQNGILELYTAKSGTKVRIPLSPKTLAALSKIPADSKYYFWSGESARRTCVNIWEDTFKRMFERAEIVGHSHQLRHTFAVRLLEKGTSMENVSMLLGHRSIKVTEKTYANWTEERQRKLEQAVKSTW